MTTFILPFEKMHGAGNDFVVLERRHMPNGVIDSELAKELCNRNFSIGADGIIIVDFPSNTDADFKWDYYNSDGSLAEMCGNGIRCFAKYVFERGFTDETTFKVQTLAGIIVPTINADGSITVNMGKPILPNEIKQNLNCLDEKFEYTYIETGNPHCVIFFDSPVEKDYFLQYGPLLEKHSNFPRGVNVEFAYINNIGDIDLKVWERGCGPTLACGTGACATLVAGTLLYGIKSANVNLPGGMLHVSWNGEGSDILMTGPAEFTFAGQYNLNPAKVCENKLRS